MRIGEVIGTVTLSRTHQKLAGTQWSIVTPLSLEQLLDGKVETCCAAEEVVLYDEFNAGVGEWVAFSEGGEAAMPFYPNFKPVDAYCAAILDEVELDHEAIEQLKMKK